MLLKTFLSKFLPNSLASRIKPKYHYYKILIQLKKRKIKVKKFFGYWKVYLPINNKKPLELICRSQKELKRISRFGLNKNDLVWKWLNWLEDVDTIYDIGSGSGFEGLVAGHLHNCKVCFIEPFTPSIETILKSVHLQKRIILHLGKLYMQGVLIKNLILDYQCINPLHQEKH